MLRNLTLSVLFGTALLAAMFQRGDAADPVPGPPAVAYRTAKIDGLDVF